MIERKDEFVEILRSRLKTARFEHSLNVADAALKLAEIYGVDTEKAYICGLLHDIEKNAPMEEQKQMMDTLSETLPDVVLQNPKLWHAPAGAAYIKNVLGIVDEDMISAIKYHTTAKADMTMLEKIVYTADFISSERNYEGVEHIRALAYEDIDKAILEGSRFTLIELLKNGREINQDTMDAYNEMARKFKDS